MRALGDVLEEVKRPVAVEDHTNYRILGVRWYAEGAWIKNECTGSEIKASRLFRVETGDLIYNRLFAWKGSFAVITDELDGCFVSNEFPAFRVKHNEADLQYVLMMLAQPDLWERIERDSAGVASISRKRLKVKDFLQLEVPIPDYELQQSSYARYAEVKRRLQSVKDATVQAGDDVAELRQTILQLAVMGRLVPQDPKDEPASELLKKIQAEKQRLIKEGKIRKPKPLPPIEPDEVPYELPSKWTWARVDDAIFSSEAGWSPQCEKYSRSGTMEWGVLKVSSVTWGKFDPNENKALPRSLEPRHELEVKQHDFLLSRANTVDLVARSVVVEESQQRLMLSDKIVRLQMPALPLKRFLNLYNNGPYARAYYRKNASGTSSSMRNVSRSCIHALPVPIPPLAEQRRIVAKAEQLMTLCDDLETKLQQAQADADSLLAAIVYEIQQASKSSVS